jgi:hypothetical protein
MPEEQREAVVRELVERYRRSVSAMSGDASAQAAIALDRALRAIQRAGTRTTASDETAAESAIRAVRAALDSAADPF